MNREIMRLSDLHTGERAIILKHHTDKAFRKRLMEMGFIPGEEILVVKNAPFKDPVEYRILNYDVTLRRSEASQIEVTPLTSKVSREIRGMQGSNLTYTEREIAGKNNNLSRPNHIRVAFVGNPNSGKTSLFNAASGANEHVGNYSGVTVEAKTATYKQGGYTFDLIDLPGAYSLSSYSPEERFVQEYLTSEECPDIILNVVDSTNLERHLYMTTQLIETSIPVVVALNMWDEFEESSSTLDVAGLSKLLGIPMTPTIGRSGKGLEQLFRHIIKIHENRSNVRRVIDVRYRTEIEEAIKDVKDAISGCFCSLPASISDLRPRYLAIKLLEEDKQIQSLFGKVTHSKGPELIETAIKVGESYERQTGNDIQHDITNGRYGFVRGALQETYTSDYAKITEKNRKIDHILTHKIWGFPIFIAIMFLTFQLTFTLGAYPMEWIEMGVSWFGNWVSSIMPEGPLRDLIVEGIIAGVGGVLVFLPNIVILYLCLAIMEDTGYMSRAAFIMDRLMHLIGLHGKSFIPMVMGFGCNVPAVMATRTIENRNNRIVTMLIIPFMSCSAKLPVYLLMAGTFFPNSAGTVLFVLYFTGILIAVVSALIFKKFFFAEGGTPFVMELPPYRIPTFISVVLHMWQRTKQYLQKMGTVILVASIAIWALSYFPNIKNLDETQLEQVYAKHTAGLSEEEIADFHALNPEFQENMVQQEYSLIGRLGQFVQPFFAPLGYDWKMSVSLLTGVAAKEVVVSTIGVLYTGNSEDEAGLSEKLQKARHTDGSLVFDPVVAFSFMIFVLVYLPCISTVIAIGKESGSWKWSLFSAGYSVALAWVLGFLVTQIGYLII